MRFTLFIILLSFVFNASAVEVGDSCAVPVDSVPVHRYGLRTALNNDLSYVGLGVVAYGALLKTQKGDFRKMDSHFMTNDNTIVDNCVQYVPLVSTYALKLAGVKGHSSWARLATSSALSMASMAAIVEVTKKATDEMRPDCVDNDAFPSGHTATAFACATILHKEYGLTRSPWYSVAGYTLASATGIARIIKNRHWINDVVVGAGVGILATDIGYIITDLIFKDRGIVVPYNDEDMDISNRPTFVNFGANVGVCRSSLIGPEIFDNNSLPLNLKLNLGGTYSVGCECAYFFNNYIGVGGSAMVNTTSLIAETSPAEGFTFNVSDPNNTKYNALWSRALKYEGLESGHIGVYSVAGGLYGSLPIASRFRIGTKLLLGCNYMDKLSLDALYSATPQDIKQTWTEIYGSAPSDAESYYITNAMGDGYFHSSDFVKIKKNTALAVGTGLSFTYAYRAGMSLKLDLDYNYSSPTITYEVRNRMDNDMNFIPESFDCKNTLHTFSMGLGMCINF